MTTTPFSFDLNPAFQGFLQTIDAAVRRGESEEVLEQVLEATLSRLDQQWETLETLASTGLEDALGASLDVFLREWAQKEALALLLRSESTFLDPTDPGLQQAFWDKLARQHQVLSARLLLPLETGKQQRAAAQQQAQPTQWETLAMQQLQDQHRQQQAWQSATFQMLQEQRTAWQTGHQVAQHWADAALDGVHQAQRGVHDMYDLATTVHTNVAGMLTTTQRQQYAVVEEAVQRANGRRTMNRILLVGVILLFVIGALGCVFFAATHLLH